MFPPQQPCFSLHSLDLPTSDELYGSNPKQLYAFNSAISKPFSDDMDYKANHIPYSYHSITPRFTSWPSSPSMTQNYLMEGLPTPFYPLPQQLPPQGAYEEQEQGQGMYGLQPQAVAARDRNLNHRQRSNHHYSLMARPPSFRQEVNNSAKDALDHAAHNHSMTQGFQSSSHFDDPAKQSFSSLLSSEYPIMPTENSSFSTSNMSSDMTGFFSPHEQFDELSPSPSDSFPTMIIDRLNDHEATKHIAAHNVEDSDMEGDTNSVPYAQLIYRALNSVPDHRMVLQDIYEWFERNTDKAKSGSSKGWQNSIRHNLSMNGAFRKVDRTPPAEDGKKGFIWVLEADAIEKGFVESTTRYRKTLHHKKFGRLDSTTTRSRSGRGNKALRRQAKQSARGEAKTRPRDVVELDCDTKPILNPYYNSGPSLEPDVDMEADAEMEMDDYDSMEAHCGIDTPSLTYQSDVPAVSPYGFDDIIGVADGLENEPLFYTYKHYQSDIVDPSLANHTFCESKNHHLGCEFGDCVA